MYTRSKAKKERSRLTGNKVRNDPQVEDEKKEMEKGKVGRKKRVMKSARRKTNEGDEGERKTVFNINFNIKIDRTNSESQQVVLDLAEIIKHVNLDFEKVSKDATFVIEGSNCDVTIADDKVMKAEQSVQTESNSLLVKSNLGNSSDDPKYAACKMLILSNLDVREMKVSCCSKSSSNLFLSNRPEKKDKETMLDDLDETGDKLLNPKSVDKHVAHQCDDKVSVTSKTATELYVRSAFLQNMLKQSSSKSLTKKIHSKLSRSKNSRLSNCDKTDTSDESSLMTKDLNDEVDIASDEIVKMPVERSNNVNDASDCSPQKNCRNNSKERKKGRIIEKMLQEIPANESESDNFFSDICENIKGNKSFSHSDVDDGICKESSNKRLKLSENDVCENVTVDEISTIVDVMKRNNERIKQIFNIDESDICKEKSFMFSSNNLSLLNFSNDENKAKEINRENSEAKLVDKEIDLSDEESCCNCTSSSSSDVEKNCSSQEVNSELKFIATCDSPRKKEEIESSSRTDSSEKESNKNLECGTKTETTFVLHEKLDGNKCPRMEKEMAEANSPRKGEESNDKIEVSSSTDSSDSDDSLEKESNKNSERGVKTDASFVSYEKLNGNNDDEKCPEEEKEMAEANFPRKREESDDNIDTSSADSSDSDDSSEIELDKSFTLHNKFGGNNDGERRPEKEKEMAETNFPRKREESDDKIEASGSTDSSDSDSDDISEIELNKSFTSHEKFSVNSSGERYSEREKEMAEAYSPRKREESGKIDTNMSSTDSSDSDDSSGKEWNKSFTSLKKFGGNNVGKRCPEKEKKMGEANSPRKREESDDKIEAISSADSSDSDDNLEKESNKNFEYGVKTDASFVSYEKLNGNNDDEKCPEKKKEMAEANFSRKKEESSDKIDSSSSSSSIDSSNSDDSSEIELNKSFTSYEKLSVKSYPEREKEMAEACSSRKREESSKIDTNMSSTDSSEKELNESFTSSEKFGGEGCPEKEKEMTEANFPRKKKESIDKIGSSSNSSTDSSEKEKLIGNNYRGKYPEKEKERAEENLQSSNFSKMRSEEVSDEEENSSCSELPVCNCEPANLSNGKIGFKRKLVVELKSIEQESRNIEFDEEVNFVKRKKKKRKLINSKRNEICEQSNVQEIYEMERETSHNQFLRVGKNSSMLESKQDFTRDSSDSSTESPKEETEIEETNKMMKLEIPFLPEHVSSNLKKNKPKVVIEKKLRRSDSEKEEAKEEEEEEEKEIYGRKIKGTKEAPTKFKIASLDETNDLNPYLRHDAFNFRKQTLFGKRIKRIDGKQMNVLKTKKQFKKNKKCFST